MLASRPDCTHFLVYISERHLRPFPLRLQISLEHSFHLLHHGHIEDAKHQLSVAESWRYGKESAAQYQRTKLIHAYRSLLDYLIWCDKKYTYSNKTGKVIPSFTRKHLLFICVSFAGTCKLLCDVTLPPTGLSSGKEVNPLECGI